MPTHSINHLGVPGRGRIVHFPKQIGFSAAPAGNFIPPPAVSAPMTAFAMCPIIVLLVQIQQTAAESTAAAAAKLAAIEKQTHSPAPCAIQGLFKVLISHK